GAEGGRPGVRETGRGLFTKCLPVGEVPPQAARDALEQVLRHYNQVGITSVIERNTDVEGYRTYEQLRKEGRLTVRATATIGLGSDGTVAGTEKRIKSLPFRFGDGDDWLRVGPLKFFVDGGILYGTAYLREPYGRDAAQLYGLTDPTYRGTLNWSADQIQNMIRTGHRLGWQMCSHVTGDGGTDLVLDAVEAADRDHTIKD